MLRRFDNEVLRLGAEACLPANISDEWLVYLADELSFIRNEEELGSDFKPPSCALSAILTILIHKNGGEQVTATSEELFSRMREYLIEIELEKMSRWSDVYSDAATIETIFTGRHVRLRNESDTLPRPKN